MSEVRPGTYFIKKTDRVFLIRSLLFVWAMCALATWSAWPIYQDPYLVVTALVATAAATVISWLGMTRNWSISRLSIVSGISYAVLVIPAAMPAAISSLSSFFSSLLSVITGPILGWKKLLTIELPVGTYEDLLVPFFLVIFVGSLTGLTMMWRSSKYQFWPVFILLAMQAFGALFGYSIATNVAKLGPISLPVSREVITGLFSFFLALAFMSWRLRYSRHRAVTQNTQDPSSQRLPLLTRLRRNALAVGVLAVAIVIAVAWTGSLNMSPARKVLRNSIDPVVDIASEASPLSDYRTFFAPENLTKELFSYSGSGPIPERIRLAVMDSYDGQVYRVVPQDAEGSTESSYSRLATDLPSTTGTGDSAQLSIDIATYQNIWMPTVENLKSVEFLGSAQQRLAEGFYYDLETSSGVEIPAFTAGDAYSVSFYLTKTGPGIDQLTRSSKPGELLSEDVIPPSMAEWVDLQADVPANPQGLLTLIERLRNRGYLSHSLMAPTSDDPTTLWTSQIPGYPGMQPSLAGQSVDRINTLYSQLVEKQKNTSSGASDAQLVAAVGDDEQFAVAASLLAEYLGYPSRVVLGFRTAAPEGAVLGVQPCVESICRGGNLTAWIELRDNNGQWIPVDVTPQFANSIAPDSQDRRDPENPTEVLDQNAQDLPPSAMNPQGKDQGKNDDQGGLDLGWLWGILKGVGTFVLILALILSPFALIIGAKIYRRRDRETEADPAENIAGGWDEYVDLLVDHGASTPGNMTRREYAVIQNSENATVLAALADQAVFGFDIPAEDDRAQAWLLVDEERARIHSELPRWRRYLGWLSLRSFIRYIGSQPLTTARKGVMSLAKSTRKKSSNGVEAFATYIAKQTHKRKSKNEK